MPLTIKPPYITAHRGSSIRAPENTIPAFIAAYEDGANAIEFDATLLKDCNVIIHHDRDFGRCLEGEGRLASAKLDEVKSKDAGAWFSQEFADTKAPTFEESMDFILGHHMKAVIELKIHSHEEDRLAVKVTRDLKKYTQHMDNILITSYNRRILLTLRRIDPDINLGMIVDKIPIEWREVNDVLNLKAIHVHHPALTPEVLKMLLEANLEVQAFTVDDPTQAKALFEAGITGIISNNPKAIAQLVHTL